MAVRILAIADTEDRGLIARLEGRGTPIGRVDAVISCGDLAASYLDYVATVANAPLFYVRGNHDARFSQEPPGGIDLHGTVEEICGLNVAGLEGSLAYRDGIVGYTQRQMWVQALKLEASAFMRGGVDILVTHTPPRGHGDLDDAAHAGFDAFNRLLDHLKPTHLLHGHVHPEYARVDRVREHPSGTTLVNCCGYQVVEIDS